MPDPGNIKLTKIQSTYNQCNQTLVNIFNNKTNKHKLNQTINKQNQYIYIYIYIYVLFD